MKIRLLGWESKGLRCPDASIVLGQNAGEVPRVALIQMPNGTGKTTTLLLLKAALTGEAKGWAPEKVMQLRRPGAKDAVGRFVVRLSVDGKPLVFDLHVDFADGAINYRTSFASAGGVV